MLSRLVVLVIASVFLRAAHGGCKSSKAALSTCEPPSLSNDAARNRVAAEEALITVIKHGPLSNSERIQLSRVNRVLRKFLTCQDVHWNWYLNALQDEVCSHFVNRVSIDQTEKCNPKILVSYDIWTYHDSSLENFVACFDKLIAYNNVNAKLKIIIDPHTVQNSTKIYEQYVILNEDTVENVQSPLDEILAERIILHAAIQYRKKNILWQLLFERDAPTNIVGREHIALSIASDDVQLFSELTSRFTADQLRNMTILPQPPIMGNQYFNDFLGIYIFTHDTITQPMLGQLLSFNSLRRNHFLRATLLGRYDILHHLIVAAIQQVNLHHQLDHWLSECVMVSVRHGHTDIFLMLVDEFGTTSPLESMASGELIVQAIRSNNLRCVKTVLTRVPDRTEHLLDDFMVQIAMTQSIPEIAQFLLNVTGVRLDRFMIVRVILEYPPLEMMEWILSSQKWTTRDLNSFLAIVDDNGVWSHRRRPWSQQIREQVRRMILDRLVHADLG